jgi:hypothetical protein
MRLKPDLERVAQNEPFLVAWVFIFLVCELLAVAWALLA